MFTTGAQMLQLNQFYLEVHGIKYAPEVNNELMQLHRRCNFVNKTTVWQFQTYSIGSSLTMADTQFQAILTSLQREATSIMFRIRPSSQGMFTDYGLGLLEENLELIQVNYITDDSGLAILRLTFNLLFLVLFILEVNTFSACKTKVSFILFFSRLVPKLGEAICPPLF